MIFDRGPFSQWNERRGRYCIVEGRDLGGGRCYAPLRTPVGADPFGFAHSTTTFAGAVDVCEADWIAVSCARWSSRAWRVVRIVMSVLVLLALFSVSACSTLPPAQRAAEATYHALHVADTLQTLQISRHPNLRESNPLLGHHPDNRRIVLYMAAEAAGHAYVSQQLVDRDAPAWLQAGWHALSIGWAARNVEVNRRNGLSISLSWSGSRSRTGQLTDVPIRLSGSTN